MPMRGFTMNQESITRELMSTFMINHKGHALLSGLYHGNLLHHTAIATTIAMYQSIRESFQMNKKAVYKLQ